MTSTNVRIEFDSNAVQNAVKKKQFEASGQSWCLYSEICPERCFTFKEIFCSRITTSHPSRPFETLHSVWC